MITVANRATTQPLPLAQQGNADTRADTRAGALPADHKPSPAPQPPPSINATKRPTLSLPRTAGRAAVKGKAPV